MSDLVVTAANVLASGQATKETGIAGASITAGQTVYKEAATGLFKLADSNSATVEQKAIYGVALHAASTGQPLTVVKDDPNFTPGATVVVGTTYWLSETPGGIQPIADLGAGEQICMIGIGKTTSTMVLKLWNTGVSL